MRSVCWLFTLAILIAFGQESHGQTPPKVGDPAPDITLPATQVEKVLPDAKDKKSLNLKDFKGKKNVVLFWYPKAMTPGCTIESCGFRDMLEKISATDTVIIGFSPDMVDRQQQFTDKEKLNFPLIADKDKKLHAALGVKGRSTWIIDKEGKIAKIYTDVKPADHPKEVLEFVEKLKK
jgi:peroxiredoxin Q/BCP